MNKMLISRNMVAMEIWIFAYMQRIFHFDDSMRIQSFSSCNVFVVFVISMCYYLIPLFLSAFVLWLQLFLFATLFLTLCIVRVSCFVHSNANVVVLYYCFHFSGVEPNTYLSCIPYSLYCVINLTYSPFRSFLYNEIPFVAHWSLSLCTSIPRECNTQWVCGTSTFAFIQLFCFPTWRLLDEM